MIVDDQPINLELQYSILQEAGYKKIISIGDEREFLEKYKLHKPSLLLLDINMPYINGFNIIHQLKSIEAENQLAIVVLTAMNDKDIRLKSFELGVLDVMCKPFDVDEFLLRIERLLRMECLRRTTNSHVEALETIVAKRSDQLKKSRYSLIQRLGKAAEYRDEETGNHILRMSHICEVLAKACGWNEELCEIILHASPMHDIGKIGIPDSILLKPAKFAGPEWEIMKTHPIIGAKLLDGDDSELMRMAKDIALYHHEKWDGSGYPYGLKGEAIPISARIASVADVFDALTSSRPYKPAWSIEKALEYISSNSESHFDPFVVDAFMNELPKVLSIRQKFSD